MSRRVDLATAATVLGLSQAAVKKRLQRGSLAGGKDAAGRWYAELDDVDTTPTAGDVSSNGHRGDTRDTTWDDAPPLVVALRETIAIQREQLSVKDEQLRQANVIIARLTSRPLELAPPADTLPDSGNVSSPRPWWRHLLGR